MSLGGLNLGKAWILTQKIFSVALLFNALLTITCVIGILSGFYFYFHPWQPFWPFLVDGNLLWFAIAAAILNIYPSASLGRHLKTGRFLFHHYFYGFLVLIAAAAFVVFFTPPKPSLYSLLTIFYISSDAVTVNIGRFFLVGGMTLLLDDLPDVSKHIESALNWLKAKAFRHAKLLYTLEIVTGAFSLYLFFAVVLSMATTPAYVALANFILAGSLLITGLTSFIFVKRRAWQKNTK
jgi:hypothetical protein